MLICSACSPKAREDRALAQGRKEFQQRNYQVAIIHFKNAMEAEPKDAEPYYQLGLAYLASRDFATASSYFHKATELNPRHAGAQMKLAELLSTSRTKEMVEESQRRTKGVLALLPEDSDALDLLAFTELRLGQPASAEEHLEQALRNSPTHLKSSVALAQTRLARKDVAGAEEALQQAAEQSPQSPEARVHLGGFYLAFGRTAEAEQQFRRALTLDPKHGPALLGLAGIQMRAGQTDEAEQTYRLLAALPDKQYKAIHATYLAQTGKGNQAAAEFEKLVQSDPEDRALRTDLVRAYLAMKRVADAEKILTAALKKNGLDLDAMLQRSRIYLASGKYTEAQNDLNQVLHFRNDSAEAHYLLAKVQQARGETAAQQQQLGEALRLDPGFLDARRDLAQALIESRGAESALRLLDGAPQNLRNKVSIIVERNWALLALGRTAEARKGIDQALASGKVPEASLQDAALKLAQKDYAGARAAAETALQQNPEEVRALNVIVQSYAAQKQMPTAVQKAREYAAQRLASARMQQFLGQLLSHYGDRAGARKAFEAAKAANPALISPNLALAELDVSEGKRADARNRLVAVVAAHPENLAGHLFWAQLEAGDGRSDAAIAQYRKALAIDGKNMAALNNLAYMLADSNRADEALPLAEEAKQIAPDNPAVDGTLGWTYFRKGMYTRAVPYLERAAAQNDEAIRKYHLAMAYLKAGDPKRGLLVLQAALRTDPKLPEADAARQLFGISGK
jgi:tetratricopeptide (TPR) repeat protein